MEEDRFANIQSVQLLGNGYLLNGDSFVPNDISNSDYRLIQEWIADGNTPEPMPDMPILPSTEKILLAALLEINELKAKVAVLEGETE